MSAKKQPKSKAKSKSKSNPHRPYRPPVADTVPTLTEVTSRFASIAAGEDVDLTPVPDAVLPAVVPVVDLRIEDGPVPVPDPAPTPVPAPLTNPVSALDLAESVSTSPEVRSAAIQVAERLIGQQLFDVTPDGRIVIQLPGSTLAEYRQQWDATNSAPGRHPSQRIPFSTYLAQRLTRCSTHTSDKSIYLTAEHVQKLDHLADDNFQNADRLVNWITRTITPQTTVTDEGGKIVRSIQFSPIPSQVYDRYAEGCWNGETPESRMEKVIYDALRDRVGLL